MRRLKESGYTVKEACEAVGISRSGYYASLREKRVPRCNEGVIRDGDLLERIKAIKAGHPFWGYRRVRAWLVHREGIRVNEKRVRRVMRENSLRVTQTVHRAKRTVQRSKPRAERPKQYWGIDMTKFMVSSLGWVYLIIVLDWFTKKIVGWDLSLRARSKEWRQALEVAFGREFPDGVRGNADTERVMRTIKEEVLWLNEFSSLEEAREKISWVI